MKAIILSAGRGSRMGELTDNSPKSLTKLFDKPLLEYQINALKSAGISEIGIITGYKSEAIKPFITSHNLIAFHNESWADSNMVYSLLCAREWLENSDFVVSYSDIFYEASGVKDLANLRCDAGILYATNWLEIWQERFPNNVLDDAESFRLDSENNLLEIGSKAKSIDEIQGQFMGLMKFSKEGFKSLCQMLQTLDIKALDSTAMLQKFIESKQCVKCVAFSGVWGEVDSQSDIKIYEKMYTINVNSPLGNHCDLANFEHLLESSLASHSKFSKEAKASTANARILGESQGDSSDSTESSDKIDSHEAKAKSQKDSTTNPPPHLDFKSKDSSEIIYVAMSADLIHPGHINILKIARDYALKIQGKVVVGLLTDSAIASYKRLPYMNYAQRKEVLESISFIDEIIAQDTLSYEANIRLLKPRYVIHGDDWKSGAQVKTRQNVLDTLKELGCGELIEPHYTQGISSTQLNEDARNIGISTNARLSLLRRLIAAKTPLRFCETHSALSALIAQNASCSKEGVKLEFDGFWSSSLTDSTSRGKPDIEAVELQSRLNTINEIFEVTSKPLIYDADTGGKVEHFTFTVRSLERTGVSALIIEDKTGLKKNSLLGNDVEQTQEDIAVFCDKITAGKKAQITQDFMIIARIESLILDKGQEDALNRAFAYVNAGADGIMIHSRQKSPNEILEFMERFRAKDSLTPIVVVPTSFNDIKADELAKAGANIIIYANHLLRASFIAMRDVAQGILEYDRSKEVEGRCMSVKEILSLIPGTI